MLDRQDGIYGIDVFDCGPLPTIPSWQYIHLISNLVELREIHCVKPSEEQAGRGFCDQCLREADAFAVEAERVLSATASIVRCEVWRSLATCCLSAAHGLRPESGVAGRRY